MKIRKAKIEEIDEIMGIYGSAREFMAQNGNGSQWVNNYPQKEIVLKDLNDGNLYVCTDKEKIAAVFCFFVAPDPTYGFIYGGKWLNDEEYGVIHRIAVAIHGKGVASYCIQWCFEQFNNLRIDTHKNNIPMQKTILKNGFKYCGIIVRPDGTERLAYQRVS